MPGDAFKDICEGVNTVDFLQGKREEVAEIFVQKGARTALELCEKKKMMSILKDLCHQKLQKMG